MNSKISDSPAVGIRLNSLTFKLSRSFHTHRSNSVWVRRLISRRIAAFALKLTSRLWRCVRHRMRPSQVMCLLSLLSPPVSTIAAGHCTSSDHHFVSCPNSTRNFHAAILAVHGWNGSCRGTFGEGDESIFRVLDSEQTHFYDFDCFEYDSRETQLLDNVHALRERINDLHHMEYNYAMLVTHSTGGILALQMLTNTGGILALQMLTNKFSTKTISNAQIFLKKSFWHLTVSAYRLSKHGQLQSMA